MNEPPSRPREFLYRAIGTIRSPYGDWAPSQPPDQEVPRGRFSIQVDPAYAEGLVDLDGFTHLWVLSGLSSPEGPVPHRVKPPWAGGREVSLFASRSPRRPNPIGLSLVRLLGREGATLHIGPVDLFDGTALLDLKPYIGPLDARPEAGLGWIAQLEHFEHAMDHLLGRSHEHAGEHDGGHEVPGHDHGHGHE
jgi:tRNA-Thr(GGU) m(6)t(6)A37 methyltransferase TsaA